MLNLSTRTSYANTYAYCLTIIRPSRSEYCGTILVAEPEENNCFSIIAQVIIRANAFSFFFLQKHQKTRVGHFVHEIATMAYDVIEVNVPPSS